MYVCTFLFYNLKLKTSIYTFTIDVFIRHTRVALIYKKLSEDIPIQMRSRACEHSGVSCSQNSVYREPFDLYWFLKH